MKYETVENYAGGLFQTRTSERQDVISPLDGSVISQVPMSDTADVEEAVRHARQAGHAGVASGPAALLLNRMCPVGAVRLALGEGRWEVDGEEAESTERRHGRRL